MPDEKKCPLLCQPITRKQAEDVPGGFCLRDACAWWATATRFAPNQPREGAQYVVEGCALKILAEKGSYGD
jgi:hypothetical protein